MDDLKNNLMSELADIDLAALDLQERVMRLIDDGPRDASHDAYLDALQSVHWRLTQTRRKMWIARACIALASGYPIP